MAKFVTGKVILSYANIWEPKPDDQGEMKYSVAVLIPKSDKDTLARYKAALEETKKEEYSLKQWGGKVPNPIKLPLNDGDVKANEHPEYAGHYYFNASTKTKPGIVDTNCNPILDQDEVYSGCYARVSVNLYGFFKKGNKGVAAGLNNIQKIKDGERLAGNRSKPEDDFGAPYTSDNIDEDDLLG